ISQARERGYSTTITGRRRPITGFDAANQRDAAGAENIAVNSPIQGSAADLIKLAMVRVDAAFKVRELPAAMLLQVHDELVFEAKTERLAEIKSVIADGMRHAMELSVPLDVQVEAGANWLEAH